MTNQTDIRSAVESLFADRVRSAEHLQQAAADAERKRVEAERADKDVARAWDAAIKAGWTPRDLEQLGFKKPATKRGGRPSGRRRPVAVAGPSASE